MQFIDQTAYRLIARNFPKGREVPVSNDMEQEYLDDAIDHNEAVWLIRKHKFTFADAIHGVKDDRRDRAIAAYLSAGGAI